MSGPRETRLPAGVATERRFVGCDLQLLALLGRHTDADGWCRRRQTRIAAELGVTRPTVVRSVARLKALGWLRVEHNADSRGMNASAAYRIVEPAMAVDLFEHAERTGRPSRRTHARVSAESQDESARTRLASQHMNDPFNERDTDDARERAPRSRSPKIAPAQPAFLLPIPGGCRPAAEPGAVPAKQAGAVPPLEAVPSAGPNARECDSPPGPGNAPAGAVRPDDATVGPEPVPSRRAELDRLEAALRAAAGAALHAVSTALLVLSDPQRWLDAGCDLDVDVIPVLRAVRERARPGSVRTWSYFTEAVFEARARRLAPAPAGRVPPTRGPHDAARSESPTRAVLRRIRGGG